jgi:hypothetical protein
MAYTVPNTGLIRPWQHSKNRYIHRSFEMFAGTAASGTITIPCPGRLVAVRYGKAAATRFGALTAATTGALTIKAETTNGVQIFADATLGSVSGDWVPLGTTAVDEARAVTAATDAFSGGFPVRGGVFVDLATITDGEHIVVDMLFRLCTYVKIDLIAESGADGTGAATKTVRLGNAGVLSAVALDFQNMPATTDVVVRADEATTGLALFRSDNSLTDLAPSLVGRPGADEGNAATAATDGTESGNGFAQGLVVELTGADIFTSGDEKVVTELWIDD